MKPLSSLYAVQLFQNGVWRTAYVSSYSFDAEDVYDDVAGLFQGPARLVSFSVDGVDFIATHARDFTTLAWRGGVDGTDTLPA